MVDKWRNSGIFSWCEKFFKIIFNKLLDFFRKCAHTMRAFKLGTVQIQISTPEISAVYGTTNEMGICKNRKHCE